MCVRDIKKLIRLLRILNSIKTQWQLKWPLKAAGEVWRHFIFNDLPHLVNKYIKYCQTLEFVCALLIYTLCTNYVNTLIQI